MQPQVLGISGSPVKNSNTDRVIQAVLAASGLATEFVKLSEIDVRPCRACLGCKDDNLCKLRDDFPALAQKVRQAGALVIGGYSPYGSMDAYTKAFMERLFSLRHVHGLNQGKLAVAVATGNGRGLPGMDRAVEQIAHAMGREGMEVLGKLQVTGNPKCMTCGHGETCALSALPKIWGDDARVRPDRFTRAEDQPVWAEAQALGRELGARLGGKA
jgi:multimeric flavodoxin WrbA